MKGGVKAGGSVFQSEQALVLSLQIRLLGNAPKTPANIL